jgi:hypothetical protein
LLVEGENSLSSHILPMQATAQERVKRSAEDIGGR